VTYDLTATYRSAQVTTSSPAAQVVLLYEGAIRFAAQSIARLEEHDLEGSHNTSLRAQAIISALRESLDLSAGDVALRLDGLYSYMQRRLVEGNIDKDTAPAREVIGLLRELLAAWRAVAAPAAQTSGAADVAQPAPPAVPRPYRTTVSGAA